MIDKGRAAARGVPFVALAALLRLHRPRVASELPAAGRGAVGDPPTESDDHAREPELATKNLWDCEPGTYVDAATITRLRDEASRTRDEIEQLLTEAGYGPRTSGLDAVDARRDLDPLTDVDLETLTRIDELHENRRATTSERSRQRDEGVLNEIMHRVIDGYQVEDKPQNRAVKAGRGVEAVVTRAYLHVSLLGRRTASAERWRAGARVVLMVCAFGAAGLLATGHVAAAALIVVARAVVSAVSTPPSPMATSHRWMAYNPDWLGGAVLNIGDAVILTGIGAHLLVAGHTALAESTLAAAVFGLSAAYLRVAAHQAGVRLPRLSIDRLVKDAALTIAVVLAAVPRPSEPNGLLVLAIAPMAVATMGAVELVRVTYYVRRHHQRVRRAAKADGTLVADAVVFKTDGDLVYRIPLSARPRPMLDVVDGAPAADHHSSGPPHLRAVGAGGK
jgi:hypothetical protein